MGYAHVSAYELDAVGTCMKNSSSSQRWRAVTFCDCFLVAHRVHAKASIQKSSAPREQLWHGGVERDTSFCGVSRSVRKQIINERSEKKRKGR